MRWTPLGLLVLALFAAPVRGANNPVVLDPAATVALQKRWPRPLGLLLKSLSDPADDSVRDRPAVTTTLNAAASFLAAEKLTEAARLDALAEAARAFRAGLEALGPRRGRYLGRDGGLGEIAREVLGDEALLKILDETSGGGTETLGLLSVRAEALYHARRYQEAEVAARRVWELSGRRDKDALALMKLSEGRTAPTQGDGEFSRVRRADAPPTTTVSAVTNPHPVFSAKPFKTRSVAVPDVGASTPHEDAGRIATLSALQLEKAAYDGLRGAVAAAPMPASSLRAAFDRPASVVERDLRLRQASHAAAEWLGRSNDPKARALLEDLRDSRRDILVDALNRASTLMDRSEAGREDARIRSALMGEDADPASRTEAARALLAMRQQDPGYFKAKSAALDYVRFNREHLSDFPEKTRFSGAELGMEMPLGSGLASIDYETTKDGRLVAVLLVSTDGSSRARGEVPGTWTIRDKSDQVTGWTLDAEAFAAMGDSKARAEAVAAAASWLSSQGFKPGGDAGQGAATASFLGDLLASADAGAKNIQVYADRTEGRLIVDVYYQNGIKQKAVRLEPGEGGRPPALALYERTVADPSDNTTPWRKAMLYRGADERELLTTRTVSNGDSLSRAVTGTTVELAPVAVGYKRDADGRWMRDGSTREIKEQSLLIHDSAGVVGGAGQVMSATGRGATDLTASASAMALAMALTMSDGAMAKELRDDWMERAKVNLVDNAFLSTAGDFYAPDAYQSLKKNLRIDDRKYIQNVRQELTDQGNPMLGAVAGAGVGFANNMLPMAAGLGALHQVSKLNVAGQFAAKGVGLIMSGKGGWDVGIAANEFNRARTHFDARDPRTVADYYTAVQDLTDQSAGQVLLLAGLREVVKARIPGKSPVASPVEKPSVQPAQLSSRRPADPAAKLGNDRAVEMASKVIPPETGYFDVVVHGSPNSVSVNRNGKWIRMDHRALARFITKQRAFDGSAIRLLSCQAGACDTGIAKNLANKLGVPVKAPTGILYVRPDGSMFIGRDQQAAEGVWKMFTPGKAQ